MTERQLGLPLPTLFPRGDLHLSAAEKSQRLIADPYWLIVAGGKTDMPTKIWSAARFQAVVNRLRKQGLRCVQGGAEGSGHRHPRLKHIENYVGRTHLREFLRLIYQAHGVLCPVSFPMHVAAAFEKPCVVIAGGREPWWWAAYRNTPDQTFGDRCAPVAVPHRYLHTIGRYDCCQATGCWKSHVESTTMTREADLCELPIVDADGGTLPRCLADITVDEVVSAILNTPSTALAGGPQN